MSLEAVENITEALEEVSLHAVRSGIAPVKAEYITAKDKCVNGIVAATSSSGETEHESETASLASTADKQESKGARKGMNKHRRKDMKHAETMIRAAGTRLCPSVIQNVKCKFGEKCTSQHDISTFLAKKPDDIGDICPIFEARGTCPFSYACRFGNAHVNKDGEQVSKDPVDPYEDVMNSSSIHIQKALRKRTYDFRRTQEVLEALRAADIGAMEREKPKLDMKKLKGKKYLAPLTTVGNLPFRRLCVSLGADITCGEMALATSLLSGTPSEYSLVKRHPSEKIFGVQVAGGFADSMAKAAQILVDEMTIDFIDVNMGCPIDVVNQKGGGCALANRTNKMVEVLSAMRHVMRGVPLTVKLRTGLKEGILTANETIASMIGPAKPDLITLHPRSKYTRLANWEFVNPCLYECGDVPLWVCGDVLSWEDYYARIEQYSIAGIMIGRGALIKPWIFTEIAERRTWDISASERLDLLRQFTNYGLDHWGSDDAGVERTRRFLLEWLSFQCRYIPVGVLERLPQRMNDRPPPYHGRNELETLLSSNRVSDWIAISCMLLGPTPDGFTFIPKHRASSY